MGLAEGWKLSFAFHADLWCFYANGFESEKGSGFVDLFDLIFFELI